MPAVKIPGAASIDVVAPARDPGVSASPEDFGSQIGSSMEHLGNAAVEIGVHLDRKRNAAAAAMAGPEAEAEFNLEATKARIEAGKAAPASGSAAQAGTDLDTQLLPLRQKIVADKRAKYGLDDAATAKLDGHLTGLQGHTVIGGVTDANNNIVQGFADRHDQTVQKIAANALATGDVDSALKQVDDSVAAMRGVVPEHYLTVQTEKSKKYVVESAIAGYRASNTKEGFDKAEALTKRFYGSVPAGAGDIYSAIYAQESGGGRNTTTSVTGARGGMQIQPATFKQYAKPGESIDNPTDNQAVGKRIIDDLSAKSGGDPARIAVGYFSGPGNIAPPGSPTPWIKDRADPTGKTTSSYVADVMRRVGGSSGGGTTKPELPDPERALKWNSEIAQARTKTLAVESHDAGESYTRQIIDAKAGIGALPSRDAIENDPRLGDNRNTLLAAHDAAAGDMAGFQAALKKFEPGGGDFNQFDKTDVANVDRIFNVLGGDLKALQVVHDRTGMVPPSAAVALRGAMVSSDPQKVEGALQLASNLSSEKYPLTFENVNGGEQLKKDVDTFRHFVGLGFESSEATRRVMEERTPEYQQKLTARIKGQDVDAIVKKSVKESDLRSAFDPTWGYGRNPTVGFDPRMHDRAMGDYEELFRQYYNETGDVDRAKTQAQKQLKVTWGVTEVNGSKVVMKWAPENARVYAGIENPSEGIAKQAIEQVKNSKGIDVTRSQIHLQELKSPVTGERYMRGVAPAYLLSYEDKNGHMQQVKGDFYADPNIMRNEQTARRAEASAKIQERTATRSDAAEARRVLGTPTSRLGPTDRAFKEKLQSTEPSKLDITGVPEEPERTSLASKIYPHIANPGATRLGGKKKT